MGGSHFLLSLFFSHSLVIIFLSCLFTCNALGGGRVRPRFSWEVSFFFVCSVVWSRRRKKRLTASRIFE